jgi:hypothetical protein
VGIVTGSSNVYFVTVTYIGKINRVGYIGSVATHEKIFVISLPLQFLKHEDVGSYFFNGSVALVTLL